MMRVSRFIAWADCVFCEQKFDSATRGGFRGGGAGVAFAFSSGIRPPADPKGPPFDTF